MMPLSAWLLLAAFLFILLLTVKPLGHYLANAMQGDAYLARRGRGLETWLLNQFGAMPEQDMSARQYTLAILSFNTLGALAVYLIQRLQAWLPFNPQDMAAVAPDSAFNTAISFVTNTNWQAYSGESTMSYLSQMLGLTVQNFLSAATALAVAFALMRGFARHRTQGIGNAWVDLYRATLYILLPLSLPFALFLVSQGAIQNLNAYVTSTTLQPYRYEQTQTDAAGHATSIVTTGQAQTLAMGPVASQEAIKMLGTNGGGFFNANSAHPYENPTAQSNFLQMLAILLIPAALCYAFGRVVGDTRQGWAVLAAMTLIFLALTIPLMLMEHQTNPQLAALGVETSGGNLEGKETRFGIAASALFAAITTAASCGAVNAMHDALLPLGGLVPLLNMQLGEVVFGGVGSGLYGMLLFAILAVFIAGLMIGRTPEYLGKKIEAYDIKMVSLAILIPPFLVLVGSAIAVLSEEGRAGISNPGAHGFSQILYAFSSAANNNGSAFAGLSTNTPFYNLLLGIVMWIGRFAVIVPVLAVAGSLAAKKRIPASAGTLPTHGPLFVTLLIGVVLIVGALTYLPALALGPVIEHLQLFATR